MNILSEAGTLSCDVPQGSILGPLLILIYINDFFQSSESDSHLYPDDTCVFSQGKDIHKIEDILAEELSIHCKWFVVDFLKLSVRQSQIKLTEINSSILYNI